MKQRALVKGVGFSLVLANFTMAFWAIAWVSRSSMVEPGASLIDVCILGYAMVPRGYDYPGNPFALPILLQSRATHLPSSRRFSAS